MDPQQAWADMLESLRRKRWEDARKAADSLYEWVRNRGFPPITIGDASLGKTWHRDITVCVCLIVANKVDRLRKRGERSARREGD